MKKFTILSLLLALMLSGCKKEEAGVAEQPGNGDNSEVVTIESGFSGLQWDYEWSEEISSLFNASSETAGGEVFQQFEPSDEQFVVSSRVEEGKSTLLIEATQDCIFDCMFIDQDKNLIDRYQVVAKHETTEKLVPECPDFVVGQTYQLYYKVLLSTGDFALGHGNFVKQ